MIFFIDTIHLYGERLSFYYKSLLNNTTLNEPDAPIKLTQKLAEILFFAPYDKSIMDNELQEVSFSEEVLNQETGEKSSYTEKRKIFKQVAAIYQEIDSLITSLNELTKEAASEFLDDLSKRVSVFSDEKLHHTMKKDGNSDKSSLQKLISLPGNVLYGQRDAESLAIAKILNEYMKCMRSAFAHLYGISLKSTASEVAVDSTEAMPALASGSGQQSPSRASTSMFAHLQEQNHETSVATDVETARSNVNTSPRP